MEVFAYDLFCDRQYEFLISITNNVVTVSCNCERDIYKKENLNEFSWGSCLQNLVTFSLTIMNDLEYNISNVSFKNALRNLLNRIRQFVKLGDIDLSQGVLKLFTCELLDFINCWKVFTKSLNFAEKNSVFFVLDTTVALLTIFHILYNRVTKNELVK